MGLIASVEGEGNPGRGVKLDAGALNEPTIRYGEVCKGLRISCTRAWLRTSTWSKGSNRNVVSRALPLVAIAD